MAATIQSLANSSRIPGPNNKVYKDECIFSFDSPMSETGLYVCLHSFFGFSRKCVESYSTKTGRQLFLHMRKVKRPKKAEDEPGIPEKVSKMAIGVEGGFKADANKDEYDDVNEIVIVPSFQNFSLDDDAVPLAVQMSAKAVLSAVGAIHKAEVEAKAGTWDGAKLAVSKHAENLLQLENPPMIPRTGWKCAKCDLTTNLWLNLTDGTILCGRKFFDGSGGNNHAVDHYQATKYPLAVKLGTITPDGKGDVFSYAEDDMVEDPWLAKHLAHFGIHIMDMEKTDKSMVELEIDINQRIGEWATLCESEAKLEPVHGPGYTGMENLGNSCYLNSVMQVLFTLPGFVEEYVGKADDTFDRVDFGADPADNFLLQMSKLGRGLLSGNYSTGKLDEPGIRPVMFKNLVGRGHAEFSGKGQQDAQEFYLHILNLIEDENKKAGRRVNQGFAGLQLEVEDRLECGTTGQVKYQTRVEDLIPVDIPMEAATNKAAVEEWKAKVAAAETAGEKVDKNKDLVRPLIPFAACLEKFLAVEEVPGFYSSAAKTTTFLKKTMRLKTFPDYLMVQLKKFDYDANWVPYKMDVEVDMPDTLDLEPMRARGQQPGEQLMPDNDDDGQPAAESAQPAPFVANEAVLDQLMDMGFSRNGCVRSLYETKNSGLEAALNWAMEHSTDANFNDPFVDPSSAGKKKSGVVPDQEKVSMLMDMSFSLEQAVKALKKTANNVEQAVEWIFNHPNDTGDDDNEDENDNEQSAAASTKPELTDGTPNYKLVAFISHMGTSHMVGHYVCHILKDDKWVIFNDSKVALSQNPPKGLAYLYLYERQK